MRVGSSPRDIGEKAAKPAAAAADRVLILSELEVEPPFRGHGLGPLIAQGLGKVAVSRG